MQHAVPALLLVEMIPLGHSKVLRLNMLILWHQWCYRNQILCQDSTDF